MKAVQQGGYNTNCNKCNNYKIKSKKEHVPDFTNISPIKFSIGVIKVVFRIRHRIDPNFPRLATCLLALAFTKHHLEARR
jgi:hypothetical protein